MVRKRKGDLFFSQKNLGKEKEEEEEKKNLPKHQFYTSWKNRLDEHGKHQETSSKLDHWS